MPPPPPLPPQGTVNHDDGVKEETTTNQDGTSTITTVSRNGSIIAMIKKTGSNNIDIHNLGGCKSMSRDDDWDDGSVTQRR